MSAAAPILLDEKKAREFLDGVDPEKVAPPIRYGRQKRWARAALEKAVARAAGLRGDGVSRDGDGSAYDVWKADK